MLTTYDRNIFEGTLSQMESAAFSFAHRYINDGRVRLSYINQTKKLSQEYRAKVSSGAISPGEAAKEAHAIRNQILETQRIKSSDVGKALAIKLKKTGLTLAELTEHYAQAEFKSPFASLSPEKQNKVYLEIIDSAGRPRPSMNAAASKYGRIGRGLLLVTIGIAVYNVATAEDKAMATAREGAIIGGGLAGGAAGGAIAGFACGPGAPVCVTIGVFVGGALGALGTDFTFGWLF